MIPLSFQRAWVLFGEHVSLQEFQDRVDKNHLYWCDVEAVRDAAVDATRKWHLTGEPQAFSVRVRRAAEDRGLEFVTLVFESREERIVLKRVE